MEVQYVNLLDNSFYLTEEEQELLLILAGKFHTAHVKDQLHEGLINQTQGANQEQENGQDLMVKEYPHHPNCNCWECNPV